MIDRYLLRLKMYPVNIDNITNKHIILHVAGG